VRKEGPDGLDEELPIQIKAKNTDENDRDG
jgi:hypothetical protein